MTQRILVVDDDRYDNDRYCQVLRSAGYEVQGVLDIEQALQIIAQQRFDVVLVDMLLPLRQQGKLDFGGIELLRRIKARDAATQVVAVTGYGSRELAAEAMAAGAFDYLTKDADTDDRLPGSAKVAVARAQMIRMAEQTIDDQESEGTLTTPHQLVADSTAMRQVLRRAERLAKIDSALLIMGEPGVGKRLLANIIHINSNFAAGPFVVAHCHDLSSSLVELFGEAGAAGLGLCAQAAGGTLVLKNIQDLPFNQQKQLVNLVRHNTYRPYGAAKDVVCHLRLIVTTTADLDRLVRIGRFWRPLYEALSVATLDVPPLRDRRDKDDILAITGYLLHHYGLASGIAPEVAELLAAHDYPQSNINELEEILRGAARQAGGGVIQAEHLPAALRARSKTDAPSSSSLPGGNDDLILSVRFLPGEPALLIWESHLGGGSRSYFHLPFAVSELPLILRALDAIQWPSHPALGPRFSDDEQTTLARLQLWDAGQVVADIDRRVGQLLYQAIVADPAARSALYHIRNTAIHKRQPLTFTLRFQPDAITMAALPWELLWDEQQPLLLSGSKLSSCIRYLDVPQAVPPAPIMGRKLRLLAVCPTKGIPDHIHGDEKSGRTEALQPLAEADILTIEELRPAPIDALTDRLQEGEPVDIMHFYGHGIWQHGQAYLQFDDGLLSASQLTTLIADIPLVVLYACRSGTVGPDDLFTGIAPTLSAAGVSVVVAMQFTIGIQAANRFSMVLYRNLARGESLQTAVAKARQALFVGHKKSWYVPVVYIRSRDMGPLVLVRR
jgi:DNA-binding NtrC family response regulator